ncbi:MAG: cupin domain-containing protein [Tannerella sp.]|jgi:uncharacterized cupin superfamily protein|nr:cupin domain-containing protein [Tannerella sp.]
MKTTVSSRKNVAPKHESHGEYEYLKYLILPKEGNQCTVAIMEIPPLKAAFPYHYHLGITEVFYIISGEGTVRTPEGERKVAVGDIIVFPPGAAGSHKIQNTSYTEPLRYVDFDTTSQPDVTVYPDSGKIGLIQGGKLTHVFKENSAVGYYEGE